MIQEIKCAIGIHEFDYDNVIVDDEINCFGTYDYVVCKYCGEIKYLGIYD